MPGTKPYLKPIKAYHNRIHTNRMSPYDEEAQRQHHPSQQIPNAAYPDSAYRPGTGQSAHSQTQIQQPPRAWHNDDPTDPPPPYEPASRSNNIPLQTLHTRTSSASQPHEFSPSSPRPIGAGTSHLTGAVKPWPGSSANGQLRRRKLKICLLLFFAVFVFFMALILGVVLGVWRSKGDDPGSD